MSGRDAPAGAGPGTRAGTRPGTRTSRAPLVVVGDSLLDRDLLGDAERLAPDAAVPVVEDCVELVRPGGAALAALLAARDGREVTLVTALGDDPASTRVAELLADRVRLVTLPLSGALVEKTRVLARGRPVLRLDRGDGRAFAASDRARATLESAAALLVADYGRGTADHLHEPLARAARRVPLVWDPHPRGRGPVPGARLVTPTAREAHRFALAFGAAEHGADGARGATRDAATLAHAWAATSVVVTLGERGALLTQGGSPLLVPAPQSLGGDPCGAGDRFAATAAGLLADGALPEEAVRGAVVAATGYVADGGCLALSRSLTPDSAETATGTETAAGAETATRTGAEPGPDDGAAERTAAGERAAVDERAAAEEVIARVRARSGTVVATGGCFDLLHPGHIGLLQAARDTGDCLVVCLNSDASVRRRKGRGRPITPLADRMRVLTALTCVDAVVVFDEDTPERLLAQLRPDIWAKGGDYTLAELPENRLLESWGGQVLLLPYLSSHSTSRIAERVRDGHGSAP